MLSQKLPDGTTYTLNPANGQWTGQLGEFITRSKDRSTVQEKLRAQQAKLAPAQLKKPMRAKPSKGVSLVTDIALRENKGELTTRKVRLGVDDKGQVTIDAVLTPQGWERKGRMDVSQLLALDESTFDEADVRWLKAQALGHALRQQFERAQTALADAFEAQADDLSRFGSVYERDRVAYKPTEMLFLEPYKGRQSDGSSGQLNHAVVIPGLPFVGTPTANELQAAELARWVDQPDGSMLRQEGTTQVRLRLTPEFQYALSRLTAEGEQLLFTGRELTSTLRLGEATVALATAEPQAVWEHRAVWRNTDSYQGGSFRSLGEPLAWPVPVQLQGVAAIKVSILGRSQNEPILAYLRQGPGDAHPVWTWAEASNSHRTHTLAFTAHSAGTDQILATAQTLLAQRQAALTEVAALVPEVGVNPLRMGQPQQDVELRMSQAALQAAYAAASEQADGEDPRPAPTAATLRTLDRLRTQALTHPLLAAFEAQCAAAEATVVARPALAAPTPVAPPAVAPTPVRPRRRGP